MSRIASTISLLLLTLFCVPTLAADEAKVAEKELEKVQKVALTADGQLIGKVFAVEDKERTLANAKLTLSADGIVIDTVRADEEGNFSFANVAPGSYQMFGYSNGLVGGGMVSVLPATAQAAGDVGVGLAPPMGYDAYAGAPVQSFGNVSSGSACNAGSCGGGGGGVGLNRRRLLLVTGAALGITAIAGGFDGKDDASPTN